MVGRLRRDYLGRWLTVVSGHYLQALDRCCAHYPGRLSTDWEAERHIDDDEETKAHRARMQERKGKGHSS